jgi:capsular polysaccharide biosynthesis protein
MSEEILNFRNFFQIIFKRFWMVLVITVVAVLASAGITYFMVTPIYQAKVNLLISGQQQTKDALPLSIDDSVKLVTTYQDILLSPNIISDAQTALNDNGYDIKINENNLSVNHIENSQVFELLVKDSDTTKASLIANAIADSFDGNIRSLMNLKVSNVKVMNKASVDSTPVSPKPLLVMGITFVIAFIVSVWIALLTNNVKKNKANSKSRNLEKS